jgi:hypothetical protein
MSPPRRSSRISGKRLRKDMFDDQAPTLTNTKPAEDSEYFQDMWDEPLEVSRDTWAVTRCLTDHGNKETKWTAGHFVAVAMWSGGLEAGIQAAKAIHIFGIWSPHAEHISGKPSALSKSTDANDILEKIWPTRERKQSRLRESAEQYIPGI